MDCRKGCWNLVGDRGVHFVIDNRDSNVEFERSLSLDVHTKNLSKITLVLVRGIFIHLQFPYAQFACSSVTGDQLFNPFWEAVVHLERCGFMVLVATVMVLHQIVRLCTFTVKVTPFCTRCSIPLPAQSVIYPLHLRPTPPVEDSEKLLVKHEASFVGMLVEL